ncbi:MAG: DUF721 domain-containing protein [Cyclobacteriaceae bacterium]
MKSQAKKGKLPIGAKRSADTSTLGEAIQEMLSQFRLKTRFDEKRLSTDWERLMGKHIADRTEKVFVKDKKLFVKIDSAPLRQDLNMKREQILDIIKNEFGDELVKSVFII